MAVNRLVVIVMDIDVRETFADLAATMADVLRVKPPPRARASGRRSWAGDADGRTLMSGLPKSAGPGGPLKLAIVLSTHQAQFEAVAFKGDFEDNVKRIAELGYDGVELAIRDPRLVDADALIATLQRYGLAVPAIGTGQAWGEEGLSFTDPDPAVRAAAIAAGARPRAPGRASTRLSPTPADRRSSSACCGGWCGPA